MSDQAARLRRAVELAVYAPVGVAVTLRDLGPTIVNLLVARGRAEVSRREEQVQTTLRHAKRVGDTALAGRVPLLAERARDAGAQPRGARRPTRDRDPVEAGSTVGGAATRPAATTAAQRPSPANGVRPRPPGNGTGNGAPAALAIPGYDALSASQVVERLDGLDAGELLAVRDYESAHRNRRTILGKIDQLAAS